jgi:hypothetical protein
MEESCPAVMPFVCLSLPRADRERTSVAGSCIGEVSEAGAVAMGPDDLSGTTVITSDPLEAQAAMRQAVGSPLPHRILAIDAVVAKDGAQLRRLLTAAGTRYLVCLPGHGIDRALLRKLESDLIIVEYLQAPTCVAHLVSELHKLDWTVSRRSVDELLYVSADISAAEIDNVLSEERWPDRDLHLRQVDGRTSWLFLGHRVFHHPMLPIIMNTMNSWNVADPLFCKLIRKYLLPVSE